MKSLFLLVLLLIGSPTAQAAQPTIDSTGNRASGEVAATLPAQRHGCASYHDVQARIDELVLRGEPIVIHAIVCLADNEHQGIVPVRPASLAMGDRPEQNLYWGARFGLLPFMTRRGWRVVCEPAYWQEQILRRVMLERELIRNGRPVRVELLAEAWRGDAMSLALERFVTLSSGRDGELVRHGGVLVPAGGRAVLVLFIGHNGLMDIPLQRFPAGSPSPPRSAAVFACASESFFGPVLGRSGANPLLLTRSLMAPEAYGPEALIRTFVAGAPAQQIRREVGAAYARYQHVPTRSAASIFSITE